MARTFLLCCFALLALGATAQDTSFTRTGISRPAIPDRIFSITGFGAKGDGVSICSDAIQKAIAACNAAGGGHVIIPRGLWLTGPLRLLSGVDLHAEAGAIVIFSADHSLYKLEGTAVLSPLSASNASDISVTGSGIFDGNGQSWRPLKKTKATAAQWQDAVKSGGVVSADGQVWWPTRELMEKDVRPKMVSLTGCTRVLIQDVTIKNSPGFGINPNRCEQLTLQNVQVNNDWWAQNGDGIDISSCKHVLIEQCTVNAGDDGICMKSSGSGGSGGEAALSDIRIRDCIVYRAHGGFVIGSNTDGGMENILVENCSFIGTDIGIRVKSNRGRGGLVRNILIRDIFMKDIVHEAVLFDTYYENVPAGQTKGQLSAGGNKIPEFRDFYFNHIRCSGAEAAISLTGLPEKPIGRLSFHDVIIRADKGLIAKDAAPPVFSATKLITVSGANELP